MSGRTALLAPVAILFLGAIACSEMAAPDAPVSGEAPVIEQDVVRLRPDGRQSLTLSQGENVSWLIGDTDIATISSDGVITAESPGMTWAFAMTPVSRDSVRVVVSFASDVEGVAFSLGLGNASLQLNGVSRIFRAVHDEYGFTEITGAVDPESPADLSIGNFFADEDTLVLLKLDSEPAVGFREVTPWEVTSGPNGEVFIYGREGAFVWMRIPDSPDLAALYVPVTPLQLEIDVSETPAEVGPATGRLTGRVSFDAAGLLVQRTGSGSRIIGQVSTEIEPFFAEFDLSQRVRPLGGGRLTVTGGPVSLSTTVGGVRVGLWNGGLVLNTGYHGVQSGAMSRHHLWLGTPAVGTFDVSSVALEDLYDNTAFAADRVSTFTETGTLADLRSGEGLPNIGLSESGTLTITRFDAPGAETWGLIEGVLETEQLLVVGESPGARQTVTLEITAPVAPASDPLHPDRPARNAGSVPGVLVVGNGSGQIHGRVHAGTEPVPDVAITLSWSGGTASVRTNEIGHFRFMGLQPGSYEVAFELPTGYALAEGQANPLGPLEVTPDQHPSAPVFVPIDLVRAPSP